MKEPIDPAVPGTFILAGRIVTMNARKRVIKDGRLYVKDSVIVAAQPASAPAPAGFAGVRPVDTKGTMFPGLIELHNHLPYNVLQLWNVPKKYVNRDQWSGTKDYASL